MLRQKSIYRRRYMGKKQKQTGRAGQSIIRWFVHSFICSFVFIRVYSWTLVNESFVRLFTSPSAHIFMNEQVVRSSLYLPCSPIYASIHPSIRLSVHPFIYSRSILMCTHLHRRRQALRLFKARMWWSNFFPSTSTFIQLSELSRSISSKVDALVQ